MTADDRFRRQLARELDRWLDEDFIGAEQRDRLRQHYQLDRLDSSASNRFVTVLLTIGAVLIALGAISFVAANWSRILPSFRAIAVVALMLGCDVGGYRLWQRPQGRSNLLGSALLLLGQLLLGASIGLMAQWVQVSGPLAGLLLTWGFGVLAMAYGVRHAPSGALALILILVGYFNWLWEPTTMSWLNGLVTYLPLLGLVAFLPLAFWCRSRWIFVLSVLAIASAFGATVYHQPSLERFHKDYLFLLGYVGFWAGLWAGSRWYERYRLSSRNLETEVGLDFAPSAQFLSLVGVLGLLSALSFADLLYDLYGWNNDNWLINLPIPLLLLAVFPTSGRTGVTVLAFWAIALLAGWLNWRFSARFKQSTGGERREQPEIVLDLAIGGTVLSLLLLLHAGALGGMTLVLTNLLLFALASVLTWQGLQLGIRWRFWLGLLALTGQIISRFFEYDTGLLLKSLVLVVCGLGAIAAGLAFEHRFHSPSPPANSLSSESHRG